MVAARLFWNARMSGAPAKAGIPAAANRSAPALAAANTASCLLGMHPSLRHTPPRRSRSISVTERPFCAARSAQT